jgi:hypothetical protein
VNRLKKAEELADKTMNRQKEVAFWLSFDTIKAAVHLRRGTGTAEAVCRALENNAKEYKNLAAPSPFGLFALVRHD